MQVRGDVRQRDVDDEYVHHTHHARQGERRENDAWMPVFVLSGCGCSPSHSSARRNQDHAAAQVAGLVAFVNRRGSVRSSRSLMSNRGSPASIMAPSSATGSQPGDLVRVAGEQDRERAGGLVVLCTDIAGGSGGR